MRVLGTWARREPEAAWDWFMKSREEEDSGPVIGFGQVSAVFSGIASKDIDLAFKRLDVLDDNERNRAIQGIAMTGAWDPEFREKLLSEDIDYVQFREQVRRELIIKALRERVVEQKVQITEQ